MHDLPLRWRLGSVVAWSWIGAMGAIILPGAVVRVAMVVIVRVIVHDAPAQYLTGLSIRALCEPSLPCATREPSVSTTTRVPKSDVMSAVS
jgi:hypothetical protein